MLAPKRYSPGEVVSRAGEALEGAFLVAEGALIYDPAEPRGCLIHDTFSCLVAAKEVSRVDNDYFLANVPIMDHASALSNRFTQASRFGGHQWNVGALGPYMQKGLVMEERTINIGVKPLRIFRIGGRLNSLGLRLQPLAQQDRQQGLNFLPELSRSAQALVAINGGFFNRINTGSIIF